MPKIVIAGNASDELKAKMAAKIAEDIIKIAKGQVKPVAPTRSRPDPINESPSYRAQMIDAGRGRLLR